MKKKLLAGVALLGALAIVTTGCSSSSSGGSSSAAPSTAASSGGGASTAKAIKVGFAQTGSESGWRAANTENMKKAWMKVSGEKE